MRGGLGLRRMVVTEVHLASPRAQGRLHPPLPVPLPLPLPPSKACTTATALHAHPRTRRREQPRVRQPRVRQPRAPHARQLTELTELVQRHAWHFAKPHRWQAIVVARAGAAAGGAM